VANQNWEAVENAIAAAVLAASSFSPGKVIWENQTAQRPALPYVSLFRDNDERLSWSTEQIVSDNPDGHKGDPDANPPVVGTELLIDHKVDSEFHVRVQVFTAETRGNNAAHSVLSKIRNYFDTDAARRTLDAVGVATIERGSVMNISALVETRFEGRAALDIRFRTADGGQEINTYISSARITPTIEDVEGAPFDAP
jgi:hypothetical protein